ncbi:MAG: tyrosine-protein phosphatase [Pseudomonadota bacterium]
MQNRVMPLEGVRNFRDFGGYAVAGGGRVKPGLLYRSGHYAEATVEDIAAVEARNITFQIDLRRPDERERQVARWSAATTVTHDGGRETDAPHTNFLRQVEADAEAADNWMNDYYKAAPFKPHHVALFTAWFDGLAGLGAEEAALVNCAAGKDRTGILCALTKHSLGVGEDDLVSDYELTNHAAEVDARLPEAARYFNEMLGKTYENDVYRPFMGVRERYLRTAFETIRTEAGTLDAYLVDVLGVDDAKRDALRARLVELA